MKQYSKLTLAFLTAAALAMFLQSACVAVLTPSSKDMPAPTLDGPSYRADRILVKPKAGIGLPEMAGLHAANQANVTKVFPRFGNLQVIRVPRGTSVENMVAKYTKSNLVQYAEPDYIVHATVTPNDTLFGDQWGMHNTGQSGGTADADIDAPEAWDTIHNSEDVIVAVIDTGIRYDHADLSANMWTNSAESVGDRNSDGYPGIAGVDDDGDSLTDEDSQGLQPGQQGYTNDLVDDDDENGYPDDIYGINSIDWGTPGDPMDDHGHGTHCAGIIGAVGNNNAGVAGVSWTVKIMALKFLDSGGGGDTSDAIECIDYALSKGADILSNSWGGGGYSQSLRDAIEEAENGNVIFVVAAGNEGADIEYERSYPSCYDGANVVSVAATDRDDELASFSNYGAASVDLGAPGVSIVSTWFDTNEPYRTVSGTSMACPHVSGALALLRQMHQGEGYKLTINRLYSTVDPLTSLAGKCTTGGRLNLDSAVNYTPADLAVAPAGGIGFGGAVGGPSYLPSSQVYLLMNYDDQSLDWSATSSQNWVTITPASGTLAAGATTTIAVSINSNADSLGAGIHTSTLTINNNSGSGTTQRTVTLKLGPVYVTPTGDDANNGSTWALAKRTVQGGIDAACPGQEVWVKAGTYTECIKAKRDVSVLGGFAGTETSKSARNWSTNVTTLDANQMGRAVMVSPGTDSTTQISGFTVCNGNALSGAGIWCVDSSPTISNNVITRNGGANPYGSGICCSSASPVIADNLIAANYGDGIWCYEDSSPNICNNTIVANSGVNLYASSQGYPFGCGGVSCFAGASPTIQNNIIAFTSSGVYKDGYSNPVVAYNCVYGNTDYDYSWTPSPTGANGNISVDPLLVSYKYGNYHIQADSPCRNAGNSAARNGITLSTQDIDAQSRVQGSAVDMGADESYGETPAQGPYTVVRVSTTGSDSNDGSTWQSAKRTVQAAIDAATVGRGEVWVKAGTYSEHLVLKPYVYLYGGFAGTETSRSQRDWTVNVTTLDGQDSGRVVEVQAAHMLSTVDGFTIANGYSEYGGGIRCYITSTAIANNTFTGNFAGHGGGISCTYSSSTIEGCLITENTAGGGGAGISVNLASPSISRCTIAENTADLNNSNSGGGGIGIGEGSSTLFANNIVSGNGASYGGGIDLGWHSYPTIRNNMIVGNTSSHGGGICAYESTATISHNIVASNLAGCGLYFYGTNRPTLAYNDVWNNKANDQSTCNYYGASPGTGDISQDPKFVDQPNGNLHLLGSSPCIDSGNNTGAPSGDKDGNTRPYDGDGNGTATCDMGAYEYQFKVIAQDLFSRTVPWQNGNWGTADLGGAWSNLCFSNGNAFSTCGAVLGVDNGRAWTEPSTGWDAGTHKVGPSASDVDVVAKVAVGDFNGGTGVIARVSAYNTLYAAIFHFDDGELLLVRYNSGTPTTLDTETGLSTSWGNAKVRLRIEGNRLRAKVWDAGQSEPATWHIDVTDSSALSAGQIGVWCSDIENAYDYDDFAAMEAVK